jgi:Ca2+-binding EF-hand superfamily protein
MVLKSLFTSKDTEKGMKLPPHLQEIKDKTQFSAKEIIDFQKKFRKICTKRETELNMKGFMKFMRMMGVKSNATLVSRIFTLMDTDSSGSISFGEFMKYFNVLL